MKLSIVRDDLYWKWVWISGVPLLSRVVRLWSFWDLLAVLRWKSRALYYPGYAFRLCGYDGREYEGGRCVIACMIPEYLVHPALWLPSWSVNGAHSPVLKHGPRSVSTSQAEEREFRKLSENEIDTCIRPERW